MAHSSFDRIIGIGYPLQNVLLARYYRARTLGADAEGKQQALQDLDFIINHPETCVKMKKAATKVKNTITRKGKMAFDTKKIALMMQQADVENYS